MMSRDEKNTGYSGGMEGSIHDVDVDVLVGISLPEMPLSPPNVFLGLEEMCAIKN